MDTNSTFTDEHALDDQGQFFLDDLFSDSGLLKRALPQYEGRGDQKKMAQEIWSCFEESKGALFEAGTGIGKSLAYLVPALLWSYRTGERIVVSTYTISLQEQLIEKDIPLLLTALGLDLRVVLAKGMGNYLCLRKVSEVSKEQGVFDSSVDAALGWAKKTQDGTRSALPFAMTGESWNKLSAESDACSYVKCPHYKECFFFKARHKAQDADLIIVNHHLLMAHLQAEEGQAILPAFSYLIVDEAHHLESVARSSLTQVLDRVELFRTFARVHSDAHPETSRLYYLRDIFKEKKQEGLEARCGLDLPGEKRKLIEKIHAAFDLLDQTVLAQCSGYRWRLTSSILKSYGWQEEILPALLEVKEALGRYVASLDSIEQEIDNETKEKVEHALLDIASTSQKIKETMGTIQAFSDGEEENLVRWAEKSLRGATLSLAQLDVAQFLEKRLFALLKSSILCSATLTVGKDFQHIKRSLGLRDLGVERVYPSPFDFKNRTRLLGISDLPPPSGYAFVSEAAKVIERAIEISEGGAFVLFTSYEMLNQCANALSHKKILKQKDTARHLLLEEFKADGNGILFGTDSFWEGVDVAGEGLRLVIIVKLPFPVPSDPLLQARAEALKKEGKDPFNEDSVPQAVMKFKQGFGRLMRHKEDRGCVLCLDQRLFNRNYGRTFLQSLPECITSFGKRDEIFSEMEDFYK